MKTENEWMQIEQTEGHPHVLCPSIIRNIQNDALQEKTTGSMKFILLHYNGLWVGEEFSTVYLVHAKSFTFEEAVAYCNKYNSPSFYKVMMVPDLRTK